MSTRTSPEERRVFDPVTVPAAPRNCSCMGTPGSGEGS
jgi:hypothetical protein